MRGMRKIYHAYWRKHEEALQLRGVNMKEWKYGMRRTEEDEEEDDARVGVT